MKKIKAFFISSILFTTTASAFLGEEWEGIYELENGYKVIRQPQKIQTIFGVSRMSGPTITFSNNSLSGMKTGTGVLATSQNQEEFKAQVMRLGSPIKNVTINAVSAVDPVLQSSIPTFQRGEHNSPQTTGFSAFEETRRSTARPSRVPFLKTKSPIETMTEEIRTNYEDFFFRCEWERATKSAANLLSPDELKSRVENGSSILTTSPYLMPMVAQLRYLSLKLEPTDFDSVVDLVRRHQDSLVPWLSAQKSKYPIFDYSLDKIHVAANQVHNKNYFFTAFLPEMANRFREINKSSLEDDTILKALFPSLASAHSSKNSFLPETLASFSFDNLQKTITQVGAVYMNLFQPAPFSELQPPESIESGPTSSSGGSVQSIKPAASAPADEPAMQASTSTFHMGKRNDYLSSGFSAFEGSHRWTVENKASITLPLAGMERRPSRISFLNTAGYVTAGHPQQRLTVKVNGKEAGSYDYALAGNNKRIDIDLSAETNVDEAVIEFEMLDVISPSDLGVSGDQRKLGILFREVQFQY